KPQLAARHERAAHRRRVDLPRGGRPYSGGAHTDVGLLRAGGGRAAGGAHRGGGALGTRRSPGTSRRLDPGRGTAAPHRFRAAGPDAARGAAGSRVRVAPHGRRAAGGRASETPDYPDERLRLIFSCCHPALNLEAQVALTLRLLGGLTTAE